MFCMVVVPKISRFHWRRLSSDSGVRAEERAASPAHQNVRPGTCATFSVIDKKADAQVENTRSCDGKSLELSVRLVPIVQMWRSCAAMHLAI